VHVFLGKLANMYIFTELTFSLVLLQKCVLSRDMIVLDTRVPADKLAIFIVHLVRFVHVRVSPVLLPFKTVLALLAINSSLANFAK
jgi:hypothetical protein